MRYRRTLADDAARSAAADAVPAGIAVEELTPLVPVATSLPIRQLIVLGVAAALVSFGFAGRLASPSDRPASDSRALPSPQAPVALAIVEPATGSRSRGSILTVAGTAPDGSLVRVRAHIGDLLVGIASVSASSGRFALTLPVIVPASPMPVPVDLTVDDPARPDRAPGRASVTVVEGSPVTGRASFHAMASGGVVVRLAGIAPLSVASVQVVVGRGSSARRVQVPVAPFGDPELARTGRLLRVGRWQAEIWNPAATAPIVAAWTEDDGLSGSVSITLERGAERP